MNLHLALDVGHSSIGWAVLTGNTESSLPPDLLGCGVVLFEKDSALASQRRLHRQQRRHVRATRTRIRRLEKLLAHIKALTPDELAVRHAPGTGHPAPWQLAARVLLSSGATPLSWPELWAVLRWYAHNRGYEKWGEIESDDPDAKDDTEKEQRARDAMTSLGSHSMAETVCRWLHVDPNGPAVLSHDPAKNIRQQKAAFPREIVREEVRKLLAYHVGRLPGLDEAFVHALIDDARALPCPDYVLPLRYRGGLLFGRLQMRYDNRIVARCVHTAATRYAELRTSGMPEAEARRVAEREAKVPSKKSPEFLRYRWGMLLANLRIATGDEAELRELDTQERAALHARMAVVGRLTKTALRDAVRTLPGWKRDNFENLFLHPDAERALLLDPTQALIEENEALHAVWPVLPAALQNRLRNRWWRSDPATGRTHSTTLAAIRQDLVRFGGDPAAFDAALASAVNTPSKKRKSAKKSASTLDPLDTPLNIARALSSLKGRAPYARPLLVRAFTEVMAGRDPKGKGGCLEETEIVKQYREGRPFDQQTNNHLLRHRLLILGRLLRDLVTNPSYGAGDAKRFSRVTIEVNRELRDHAGLKWTKIAQDLGLRLKSHHDAVAWLEEAGLQPGGSLIRKARVALDLGCRCPYTDVEFEAVNLRDGLVDLDHIIPRSQRPSDSLDSLAITFPAVNKWKGARTAWQFIKDCGGQEVPGAPHLSIVTPQRFQELVRKLDTKGHDDDVRRKRRRKEFFLLERYEEKERDFTPGQLTQTSQLTRLARIAVRRALPHLADHDLVALPGSVTAAVRKSWNLMQCLATVTPAVLGKDGQLLPKHEIRSITHLHHAVDAITLGYASALLENRGDLWRLLSQRRISPEHREHFRSLAPVHIDGNGRWQLRELLKYNPAIDQRIRACLAERRVVQHVPVDMSGLRTKQNTRGFLLLPNEKVQLRPGRDEDGNLQKAEIIPVEKAFGLKQGKLAATRGVRMIADNYGVAIIKSPAPATEPQFSVIRWHRIWQQLHALRKEHGPSHVCLLRSGYRIEVPAGTYAGRWVVRGVFENAKHGMLVDLTRPDFIPARLAGSDSCKNNVSLRSLLKNGAEIVRSGICG